MAKVTKQSELTVAELEQLLANRKKGIDRLKRKRDKLQAAINALDEEIRQLGGNGVTNTGRVRNDSSLGDVIADVLREAGSGVRVGEIINRVLATGYRTGSVNFRSIVNQALIKDERFVASERGVYTLRK
jgi:hypothetical protein